MLHSHGFKQIVGGRHTTPSGWHGKTVGWHNEKHDILLCDVIVFTKDETKYFFLSTFILTQKYIEVETSFTM